MPNGGILFAEKENSVFPKTPKSEIRGMRPKGKKERIIKINFFLMVVSGG